jgi:hypothetical protein
MLVEEAKQAEIKITNKKDSMSKKHSDMSVRKVVSCT